MHAAQNDVEFIFIFIFSVVNQSSRLTLKAVSWNIQRVSRCHSKCRECVFVVVESSSLIRPRFTLWRENKYASCELKHHRPFRGNGLHSVAPTHAHHTHYSLWLSQLTTELISFQYFSQESCLLHLPLTAASMAVALWMACVCVLPSLEINE